MSLKRDLALLIVGLVGQILGMTGIVIVVFSMLAEVIYHIPAGINLWIGGGIIVVAVILLEIMIRENRKDAELCQCPCGCRNKRDGLEDLCHYCMETHEDLRKDFVEDGA